MAYLGGGAVTVVGNDFYDYCGTAGAVSLVGDLLVVYAAHFARGLLYGAGNVVIRHVVCLCLGYNVSELGVVVRVATALFNGYGDLSAYLGKDLTARIICLFFFIFDIGPFGMS